MKKIFKVRLARKLPKEEVEAAAWFTPAKIEKMVKKGKFIEARWDRVKEYFQ